MSHEFSIIVPVLNEADCVERLVDEISQVFSGRSYEMVFVDDGSTAARLCSSGLAAKRSRFVGLKASLKSLRTG